MSLFALLSQVMSRHGDKLSVNISTTKEGADPELRLIISANLGPTSKDATEQEAQRRASLAMPLVIQGTAADCEYELKAHINKYARHVDETAASILRMQQAKSAADNAKPAPKPKASPKQKASQDDEPDNQPKQATTMPAAAPSGADEF
ncbi:hypothetical protein VRRI112168_00135 [Vreelandella rituensis]|uniref:PRTRC system protein E n=1 Tax=Vreelandella rituensis TaxID=2282306 RepID=A0A368UDK7_9GAMM|nr:hypothetical protein [Halomonas rituensis]RCV93893.1 hypothetical protein DU506_01670 [Halomonas rituensis]